MHKSFALEENPTCNSPK